MENDMSDTDKKLMQQVGREQKYGNIKIYS